MLVSKRATASAPAGSGRREARTRSERVSKQRACDGMKLDEFKEQVRHTFGDDLHRASPAAVRDFLDRLQEEMHIARISNPGSNGLYDRRIDVDDRPSRTRR
jgi:hypothetical protein